MRADRLARLASPAALAAALAALLFDVPHVFLGTDVRRAAATPLWRFHAWMGLLSAVLALAVLLALGARLRARGGRLATGGLVVAAVGTVLAAGADWAEAVLGPSVAAAAPRVFEQPSPDVVLATLFGALLFGLGWVLVAAAAGRAGVLPARSAAVFAGGVALGGLPVPGAGVLLALGLGAAGLALRPAAPARGWRPAPAAVLRSGHS
jgi:hypothetical protein